MAEPMFNLKENGKYSNIAHYHQIKLFSEGLLKKRRPKKQHLKAKIVSRKKGCTAAEL